MNAGVTLLETATLFTELGFYIHPNKSVFMPTQALTFLGFILDSVKMTISPTPEKVEKIVKACSQMVKKAKPLILDVARVIGLIISMFLGAEYGPLHYRILEHDKTNALVDYLCTTGPEAHLLPHTLNGYPDRCIKKGVGSSI